MMREAGRSRRWFVSCALLACACSSKLDRPAPRMDSAGVDASLPQLAGHGVDAGAAGGPAMPLPPPPRTMPDAGVAAPKPTPPPVMRIDQCGPSNPAGLSAASAKLLMAGGPASGMRFLYPYAGTVFPRGLIAPSVMWEGGPSEAVYVRLASSRFEYSGCLKPSAAGQLQLPQDVWDAASAHALGPSDPFSLELTTLGAGVATGPIKQSLVIAQATVKGSIFYNSYSSPLAKAGEGGAVLRIPAGGKAELFLSRDCTGCHSVSANGARLLSQSLGSVNEGGFSFALTPNAAANPVGMKAGDRAAFGALYPDGSLYVSTSTAVDVARAGAVAVAGDADSALYETDTGTRLQETGIPGGALMPMFSPSGRLLVFNDFELDSARGLALMDFDVMTRRARKHRVIFRDKRMRPGWPFVLPDDRAVIFTRTDGADFSGQGAGIPASDQGRFGDSTDGAGSLPGGLPRGPSSDLYVVDLHSGKSVMLARAMGYDTAADAQDDKTYLPFGAEELHENYFPTVAPVGAGGYFWIFFDSVRHYGNRGLQRQLWGAALEIAQTGDYAVDRSHPAFYLPGQELGTGNHRAFAALDPCKQNAESCTSGVDCCGGFCSMAQEAGGESGGEPVGRCSSEVPSCARTGERCGDDGDCCVPADAAMPNLCIAGVCTTAFVPF